MRKKEVIDQLESLKANAEWSAQSDPDEKMWQADVKALNLAIRTLKNNTEERKEKARKAVMLAVALIWILSILLIFATMGSLETDYITIRQGVLRTSAGILALGASTLAINILYKEGDYED